MHSLHSKPINQHLWGWGQDSSIFFTLLSFILRLHPKHCFYFPGAWHRLCPHFTFLVVKSIAGWLADDTDNRKPLHILQSLCNLRVKRSTVQFPYFQMGDLMTEKEIPQVRGPCSGESGPQSNIPTLRSHCPAFQQSSF